MDQWLVREALRAFPDLDPRLGEDATPSVIALKRHPAVRAGLDDIPIEDRATRDDLLELWGDPWRLEQVVAHAGEALTAGMADAVRAHAEVQFAEIDLDSRGRPILGPDGLPLHVGTPINDAGTVDVEDLPVLFALDRFRRPPRRWAHVVVDEAQEVGPLELAVLRHAVSRRGCVTIAGDADQQIDPTAWFAGWEAALQELGAGDARRIRLGTGFRCPPEVLALARAIRDGGELPPVRIWDEVLTDDPGQTAVIAWSPAAAREAWRAVVRHRPARLALDNPGDDRAGTLVAPVTAVRGLEFDRVVIADPGGWPRSVHARNALFVALTRARRSGAFASA